MVRISDTFLTGSMYAPFCRTLSAPMEEWDRDMQRMKELGYSCLHGFAEWHDIEREKGRFDFTQIDHFVACAAKNGLVPIINVVTQNSIGMYSPRWLMEEYRGTADGFVDSQGVQQVQSEYLVPCIDHPIYQAYAKRYLAETAKHFAGDERVGGYVIWGEPTLFSPASAEKPTPICYCEHTKAKFRTWLKERYGDIAKLNAAWCTEGPTDYIDFCQVNPPTGANRQNGGFCSWDDWREFMESNLAGHIHEANRIFRENGATQPTITEMYTGMHNGIDPWKLGETSDIVGVSLFGKPTKTVALAMSVADSIAKANGKSTFIVEAGGGSIKFDNPNERGGMAFTPSAEELMTTLLMRAGYGTKGIMYWCWRARLSDLEGNDFGMCRPDGKPLKRTKELGKLAEKMRELSPVYNAAVRSSDVAIFMSQSITHLMEQERMTENYQDSLSGASFMLTDLHVNSDFICEKEILKGSLSKYKVLVLPCSYVLSEACAEKIREFVRSGGHVIADYILAEKRPGGLCYVSLPGGGLDEVFGIEREDVLCIAHKTMLRENTYGVAVGSILEEVVLCTAEVYGEEYMPGYPMMTTNQYGKGTATYFCTQYFANYYRRQSNAIRSHMANLLAGYGIAPYLSLECEDGKDESALITGAMYDTNGETKIITVCNTDYEEVTDTLRISGTGYAFVKAPGKVSVREINGETEIRFTLGALESFAIYRK